MIFEHEQRIVFIGDSITDAGRRGEDAPYGRGYMSLVRAFITARYPERRLEWDNRGISGDTVRDLAARWDQDVIALKPDWLVVKIGINDVWRKYKGREAEAVSVEEYEETLRRLLQRAVAETSCKLIVAEPYVIETDTNDPQLAETREYGQVARRIASQLDAINIRTQEAFDAVLQHSEPSDWAADRIHPNLAGHSVIAQAFLDALGFELPVSPGVS